MAGLRGLDCRNLPSATRVCDSGGCQPCVTHGGGHGVSMDDKHSQGKVEAQPGTRPAAGRGCGVDLVCAGDAAHTAEGHQRPGAGNKPRELSRQADLMAPVQSRPRNNAAQPLITLRAQTKQLAQARGGRIFSGWEESISPPSFCAAGRTEPAPGPRTGISTA